MTDTPLRARLNRDQTRVVCGHCSFRLADVEVATLPFLARFTDFGGQPSDAEYLEVHVGERYVSMASGLLPRTDGFWDVSGARLGQWRARGLPANPRNARGQNQNIPQSPARVRCPRCRAEQLLDAGGLGIAQRLKHSDNDG